MTDSVKEVRHTIIGNNTVDKFGMACICSQDGVGIQIPCCDRLSLIRYTVQL